MSDGALKPEKDFSKEVDKQIPEAEALAKVRPFGIRGRLRLSRQTLTFVIDRYPSGNREALGSREADAPGKPSTLLPLPLRRKLTVY